MLNILTSQVSRLNHEIFTTQDKNPPTCETLVVAIKAARQARRCKASPGNRLVFHGVPGLQSGQLLSISGQLLLQAADLGQQGVAGRGGLVLHLAPEGAGQGATQEQGLAAPAGEGAGSVAVFLEVGQAGTAAVRAVLVEGAVPANTRLVTGLVCLPLVPDSVGRVPLGPAQGAGVGPQHWAGHYSPVWGLQAVGPADNRSGTGGTLGVIHL